MLKFLSLAERLCPYTPDPFSLAKGGVWVRDYLGYKKFIVSYMHEVLNIVCNS